LGIFVKRVMIGFILISYFGYLRFIIHVTVNAIFFVNDCFSFWNSIDQLW
jgi:hypothetical protein